jgi:chromosome segregation ATPase
MEKEEVATAVQSELAAWFLAERALLAEREEHSKTKLEGLIERCKRAQREYPDLLKEVTAKRKILESLPSEIALLEQRLAEAEMSKDDDESNPFSSIRRARTEYERAKWEAQTFVADRLDDMKRSVK